MPQREDETAEQFMKRVAKAVTRRVELHGELFPIVKDRCKTALLHDDFLTEPEAGEAAFHLADWIGDLVEFNEMLIETDFNPERAQMMIIEFLAHVPHHLAAAHKIVGGEPLEDVFELGAVKGSGDARRRPGESCADRFSESKDTDG